MKMTPTDWIAAYAAVVSTVVFGWQLKQSRPQVKVVVAFGVKEGEVGAWVSVQNLSSHALNLGSLTVMYPWRKIGLWRRLRDIATYRRFDRHPGWVHTHLSLYKFDAQLPDSIGPHDSCDVLIPERVLQLILKDASEDMIVVKVQDAVWRDHYSNRFHFPVERTSTLADK